MRDIQNDIKYEYKMFLRNMKNKMCHFVSRTQMIQNKFHWLRDQEPKIKKKSRNCKNSLENSVKNRSPTFHLQFFPKRKYQSLNHTFSLRTTLSNELLHFHVQHLTRKLDFLVSLPSFSFTLMGSSVFIRGCS